jgi:integrase
METVSTVVQSAVNVQDSPTAGKPLYEPVYRPRGQGMEKVRGLWKRGSRYYCQLRVTTVSGKRIPKKVALPSEVTTIAQAVKAMDELKAKEANGELQGKTFCPKFADYYLEYLDRAKNFKDSKTLASEKSYLQDWLGHFGQELRLNQINEGSIQQFLDVQRLNENPRTKKPLTNHTLNVKVYALRSVLKMARDDGKISRLPFQGIKKLKYKPARKTLPSVADIEKVIEAAIKYCPRCGHAFADYIRLLMFTGAREQEALNLQWSDIDMEGKRIRFHRGTKFDKERFLDFNPKLENHLRSMLLRRQFKSPWLFPSPRTDGAEGRVTNFRQTLQKARDKAGVYLSEHYLRHHFTSMCVMAGVERFSIVKWLGHGDGGKLIAEVYGHLSNEFQLKEAAKLTNL